MNNMKVRLAIILALSACFTSCSANQHDPVDLRQSAQESNLTAGPITIDPGNQQQLDGLTGKLAENRAIFIGEVHDRLDHHQNQLRIIKNLYARYPDLAIGVEYFQHPFQSYLDDYIAGRIDEREMLRKTEYFKRWKLDYRLIQPIIAYAREKHIPVLALNVSDEIHNKVFKGGMKSLDSLELAQTPDDILPASAHYLQRLKSIYSSHPPSNNFGTFVEGVLLWDEYMAEHAAEYLKSHPRSRMVVLSGMVHVMYGDGIPERLNRRLGSDQSTVLINGSDFGNYPGVADYQLLTENYMGLPVTGKLGVSIIDGSGGVRISEFTADSAAQAAGLAVGDRIVVLDGVKVANISDLKSMMFDRRSGERVQVMVQRDPRADPPRELQFQVVLR
jgi:uncharacterized iron-regulated protein